MQNASLDASSIMQRYNRISNISHSRFSARLASPTLNTVDRRVNTRPPRPPPHQRVKRMCDPPSTTYHFDLSKPVYVHVQHQRRWRTIGGLSSRYVFFFLFYKLLMIFLLDHSYYNRAPPPLLAWRHDRTAVASPPPPPIPTCLKARQDGCRTIFPP